MSKISSESTTAATPVVTFFASNISPLLGDNFAYNCSCNSFGIYFMFDQLIFCEVTSLDDKNLNPFTLSSVYIGV